MTNEIRIEGPGVDLAVKINGLAPDGIVRAILREVRNVAFDYVPDVVVTQTQLVLDEDKQEDQ